MITKINSSIVPYDNLIQALCRTPYHGHAHGCINFGYKDGCPPQKIITDILDFDKELYLIFTNFSIGRFAERMRLEHPEWDESTYPDRNERTLDYVQSIEDRLRKEHPEWPDGYYPKKITEEWTSSREWYNPRRWQETARKEQRQEEDFKSKYPCLKVERFPEAHGINLTGLMYNIGIELTWMWPPKHDSDTLSYLISVGGYSLDSKKD